MKKTFAAHLPITEADIQKIWAEGFVVCDANVLLNLYRYSKSTRADLLGVFEAIQDRLWLPHQAALEFLEGRLGVLAAQRQRCGEPVSSFKKVLAELDNKRGFPFVSAELRKDLDGLLKRLETEVDGNIAELDSFEATDTLMEDVLGLFDERVGAPFNEKELKDISAEGERRYREQVPPGFEDRKKPTEQRRYGDLILWKQMLAQATKSKRPLLFVTDDAKDDWWQRHRGKTLGPHPVLRQEAAATGQLFYIYSSDGFLERASAMLKKEVRKEAINEVRETVRVAEPDDYLQRAYAAFVTQYPELKDEVGLTSTGITLGPLSDYLRDLLADAPAEGLQRMTRNENWRSLNPASRAALWNLAARLIKSTIPPPVKGNVRSLEDDPQG
jgi:hypothetical protein